jgi:hypothetical protein
LLPEIGLEASATDTSIARFPWLEGCALILLIMCAGFACVDVFVGQWDHDGGFYLLHSAYVADGMRPYIDYTYIYPPLMDVLTAFALMLPLERFVLALAIPAWWILANTIATALLIWTCTRNRGYALVIAALFPLFSIQNGGNHLTLEHGVALFSMLALVIAMRSRNVSPGDAAVVGFFFAAACLSKQNGVITVLPLAAIAFHRRTELSRKHALGFASGAAGLGFMVLAWLRFDLVAIFTNLFGRLVTYAEASAPAAGWPPEVLRAPQTYAMFLAAGLCAAVAALRLPRFRLVAIAAAVGAALQFLPRLIRDYPHYNLNMWPFLALAFVLAWRCVPPRYRSTASICTAAGAVLLFVGVAANFPFSFPRLAIFQMAATQIRALTPANAAVRQYGNEPILEFLAERREEVINRPDSVMQAWDGSGLYASPPAPDTTIVIVNIGQRWLPSLRQQVKAWGFVQRGAVGPIAIYRKR